MRGWPPAEVLLLACLLAAVLLPVMVSTKTHALPESQMEIEGEQRTIRAFFTAKFAHPPELFYVEQDGVRVWETNNEDADSEFFQEMRVPLKEGLEALVGIRWPAESGETAVEFKVEPDGLDEVSKVIWGSGEFEEILFFRW